MSKVFIEGMDMPKSCKDCRLCIRKRCFDPDFDDEETCSYLDEYIGRYYYTRYPKCPLKECE